MYKLTRVLLVALVAYLVSGSEAWANKVKKPKGSAKSTGSAYTKPTPKPVSTPVSTPTDFPFCKCIYKGNGGPYYLDNTEVTTSGDETTVCMDLETVSPPESGTCSVFDLKKIEWEVETECRGAVKTATFGGKEVAPSFTSYNGGKNLVYKLTRGKTILGTYSSLKGKSTQVCITLRGPCATPAKFCKSGKCKPIFFSPDNKCCTTRTPAGSPIYPPPASPFDFSEGAPPPPGLPFPYCPCNTNAPFAPYSIARTTTSTTDGLNTYCFDVKADKPYSGSGSCTNYDLKKLEWDINKGCQMAVKSITWDGDKLEASYTRWPAQSGLVFKVTKGKEDLESYSGAATHKLCLTLNDLCPTLSDFCKGPACQVAFFSPDNNCCPKSTVAY